MKGALKIVAFGLGGLVLALSLSLGAIAIAGRSLGEPPRPLQVPSTDQRHSPSPNASPSTKPGSDDHTEQSPSASPSDDHGGNDGSGSDDSGGSADDHGGDD